MFSRNTRAALGWLILGLLLGTVGTALSTKKFSSSLDTSKHVVSTPIIVEGIRAEDGLWRLVEEKREGQFLFKTTEVLCLWKIMLEVTEDKPGISVTFLLYDRYGFELATDAQSIKPLLAGTKHVVQSRFWLGAKIASSAHHAAVRLSTTSTSEERPVKTHKN